LPVYRTSYAVRSAITATAELLVFLLAAAFHARVSSCGSSPASLVTGYDCSLCRSVPHYTLVNQSTRHYIDVDLNVVFCLQSK